MARRDAVKRASADLAAHLEIKPRATDPKPYHPNDAARRLQLSPRDARWGLAPPYGWVRFDPLNGLPRAASWRCWYCAEFCGTSQKLLYSAALSFIAHVECFGTGDTIM